jgi:hypothetical protein
MGMLDIVKNYLGAKDRTEAVQPSVSRLMRIKDTTPRAKPTNNLTSYASVDLVSKVIESAKRQGVPAHAALAEVQKETEWGNRDRAGIGSGWFNPMQYNGLDMAPVVQPGDKRDLKALSQAAWKKKLDNIILTHPKYKDAVAKYNKLYENGDYLSLAAERAASQHIDDVEDDVRQSAYIDAGVNYLKKMIQENKGNLTNAFASYRGEGQAARYHGKHVMELYDSLKKNKEINRMVGR